MKKGGIIVVYIGDYFAIALVGVVFLFFLDTKTSPRYMSAPSKLFIVNLMLTAATALTDLLTVYMLGKGFPLWLNMVVNSAYFIFGTLTTTGIAL